MRFGVVVMIVVVSFFAGGVTAGYQHWSQPMAEVHISNDVSSTLKSLTFSFSGGGIHSTAELPKLAAGEAFVVRFFLGGEGSYSIDAVLANGKTVTGGNGYIESGYAEIESITEGGIKRH